jgi:hypothetical protein
LWMPEYGCVQINTRAAAKVHARLIYREDKKTSPDSVKMSGDSTKISNFEALKILE